jgi:hypothetical protein
LLQPVFAEKLMRSGVQQIPPMNAVYFGAKAAEALALEVEKRRS